ncbi:MAG: hypothetical protein GKR90_25610 [Pseudomonadales bacterium]|nr:hypothetical protein [Pseudomonadales bacterium]
MRQIITVSFLFCTTLSFASVTVVDGNHLKIEGNKFRLAFVEAPGLSGSCDAYKISIGCGSAARNALRRIVRGRDVVCESVDDRYLCFVGSREINAEMIAGGFATVSEGAPRKYESFYKAARAKRQGLWRTP